MKTLYLFRGLPASGKSTRARGKLADLNMGGKVMAVRTNKDELRNQLDGGIESRVIRRESELVADALNAGLEVILDNTHFNPHHERRYRLLAEKYGCKFELKSFAHVPLQECIRRDQNPTNPVGEA
jgi:predicted kinase